MAHDELIKKQTTQVLERRGEEGGGKGTTRRSGAKRQGKPRKQRVERGPRPFEVRWRPVSVAADYNRELRTVPATSPPMELFENARQALLRDVVENGVAGPEGLFSLPAIPLDPAMGTTADCDQQLERAIILPREKTSRSPGSSQIIYDSLTYSRARQEFDQQNSPVLPKGAILKDLYANVPEAKDYLSSRLLVHEDQIAPVESTDAADARGAGGKRKRNPQYPSQSADDAKKLKLRYATCRNCGKDFDVTENTSTSCHFHTEPYEMNQDYFQDDWEETAGEWCKEDWPEAFVHGCCQRDITQDPCATGYHQGKVRR
ncbi:uncharacterized protein BO97DRAFT_464485 [Aspergillus homomorphus CBS 101889]|uniref:Uncharacterized protein n=1 Tax=Aspergillus homomorphus (strain CBS 101889) TaxID=1450537 RepID=A0A395HLQ3_ASPHC|nr:hypothetical protein BO97DRAFT_464485 [Aspergillus homomorphus CBS 101889]RAL07204.1 hypothetical protein BO97DRAFT_464485 [Aspergillus homomorphus CBS 101889]